MPLDRTVIVFNQSRSVRSVVAATMLCAFVPLDLRHVSEVDDVSDWGERPALFIRLSNEVGRLFQPHDMFARGQLPLLRRKLRPPVKRLPASLGFP